MSDGTTHFDWLLGVDEASEKARQKARKERVHTHRDYSGSKRAQNTNCKEEKCRRVTYRSSEYCYMHQSQESQ